MAYMPSAALADAAGGSGDAAQARDLRAQGFKTLARFRHVDLRDDRDDGALCELGVPCGEFVLDGLLVGEKLFDLARSVHEMQDHARALDMRREAIAQPRAFMRAPSRGRERPPSRTILPRLSAPRRWSAGW